MATEDEPGEQRQIRARIHAEHRDHIHNDLGGAARYFERRVRSRIAAGDQDGIFFEMVAALVMSAFAMEANLNFIGHQTDPSWNERAPFGKKLSAVLAKLAIEPDMTVRPFSCVRRLKQVRDDLAHGKPQVLRYEEVAIGTHDELERRLWERKAEWEKLITPEFVSEAYDDVEAIWQQLLEAAGIDRFATFSGGSSGITFMEFADEQPG